MTSESVLQYPHASPPEPGEVRSIAPGVHWLRMPLPFALNHINLWLLEDGDAWVIVDTGLGNEDTRKYWDIALAATVGNRPVSRVILTHHHPDHSGNAGWLTRRFNAPLLISMSEYLACHSVLDSRAGYDLEALLAMYRRNGLTAENEEKMRGRGAHFQKHVKEFPTSYSRLLDGMVLSIGGRDWRLLVGYGHSPEHVSLYCEDENVLISGDMMLPRITTNVSVQAVEPLGNPLKLFLDSTRAQAVLPADTLVLPSHGLPFRGIRDRVAQLVHHHDLRLAEVAAACKGPTAAAEVIPVLFRRPLDAHQMFFAMGESMAHLHLLEAEGRVVRTIGSDGVLRYAAAGEA